MAEIYVERQYWTRWPRVLIVCKKRGRDESGNLIVERKRYVPEGGTRDEWNERMREVIRKYSKAADKLNARILEESEIPNLRAEVDGLKWAVEERDSLIRDMALWMRCPRSCADCEMEGDEGCAFMTRALEMGVEI